jgi:hypothetical protein
MIKWKRPNGSTIETNSDAGNIKQALSLGWVLAEKPKQKRRKNGNSSGSSKTGVIAD